MNRLLRRFVLGSVIMAGTVIAVIMGIGWFIAPQDVLQKSDAIVVVSGGDTQTRTSEGVKLWKEGWAPILVFAGAAADRGTSNAAVMSVQAVSEGVPIEHILIEERSTNTKENAVFLKPLFEAHNLKSAILVSSPYHTRRVKTSFRSTFGEGYRFYAHPAIDSVWRRSTWWRSEGTINLTWGELQKTFYVRFIAD